MKTPEEVIERHRHLDTKAILGALESAGFAIVPRILTREEARRIHPSKLQMRWHRFSDRGPPEWEGYTYMGPQNYGNPFNPDMCHLLWVRLKSANA